MKKAALATDAGRDGGGGNSGGRDRRVGTGAKWSSGYEGWDRVGGLAKKRTVVEESGTIIRSKFFSSMLSWRFCLFCGEFVCIVVVV